MDIEISDNMVINGSVIDAESVKKPIMKLLENIEDYESRFVGGLHNLNLSDKSAWVRNNNGPLRIIEVNTGREEIWFFGNSTDPVYISLNENGLLESHRKYNHYMPAVHYSATSTPILTRKNLHIHDTHLDLWYRNQELSNFDSESAVSAGSRAFKIGDKNVDYIQYILFDRVEEDWENNEWKTSRVSGPTIIFNRDDLNTSSNRNKASKWLKDNCKGGFFPFGEQLFGDKEEEFMFVADICT